MLQVFLPRSIPNTEIDIDPPPRRVSKPSYLGFLRKGRAIP
jgi:hypothetical protein